MLYLIPTIRDGYAQREFAGICRCLNVHKLSCKILSMDHMFSTEKIFDDDFYIISDYYFNPVFKEEDVPDSLRDFIQHLPEDQVAIYYSDPTFKFKDPTKFTNWKYFVFFGLSRFRETMTEEYKNCAIWENVDINTKKVLDIPISEMAFWSYGVEAIFGNLDSVLSDPNVNDISYIINSKIKSRMGLLKDLEGLKCQLGNFPAIHNRDIQSFVKRNPQNTWETEKVFGKNYLTLQNGLFTLVRDDDKPIKVSWPMRFYEAMIRGIIPIIHTEKGCQYVYDKRFYPNLSQMFYNDHEDLVELIKKCRVPDVYHALRMEALNFLSAVIYSPTSLHDQTFTAIKSRKNKER